MIFKENEIYKKEEILENKEDVLKFLVENKNLNLVKNDKNEFLFKILEVGDIIDKDIFDFKNERREEIIKNRIKYSYDNIISGIVAEENSDGDYVIKNITENVKTSIFFYENLYKFIENNQNFTIFEINENGKRLFSIKNISKNENEKLKEELNSKINILQKKLDDTDYKTIRHIEKVLQELETDKDEYFLKNVAEREKIREEINKNREVLENL